jgi:pyruvate dehydrogenase E1 component alpha subunit
MNFRNHAINREWSSDGKIDLYRQMARIRRFEQAALKCYQCGEIGGWLIMSIGQESVAAGIGSVMGPHDHSISGCRGMGHALAAGIGMNACMAELFGKTQGCSKGKAGMFTFYEPARHHWGSHGLVSAQTPLAAGIAFALKLRGIKGAAVCFLGDGSVNAGAYHESLNLAGIFGLPVVYVIENNGYAMGTSVARSSVFKDCLARRAEAYGIDWDFFGDEDPYEIRARFRTAIERARQEQRPTVLEISTYRYYGFTISDANHKKYRTAEEIEERRSRDPMMLWGRHLVEETLIDEGGLLAIDEGAKAEARAAVEFARNGAIPSVSDIQTDVYWECDHETASGRTGWHFFDP